MRYLIVLLGTAAAFGFCFALAHWDPFDWLPDGKGSGVEVASAFAGAMATAAPGAWWAVGRRPKAVRQRLRARENSDVIQESGIADPDEVDQDLDAAPGAVVRQTGGRAAP
ncbi:MULTISPECIES: hypothetical protein [unclassified Streptomyces]|uniref:hypothetical protein n=1 Tax=unclassified Streptomyces TaxID=2593676 RepID=UPI002E2A016B|nr:hypothetical protein [Streptomyces sp. NBC_01439]